MCAAPPPGLVLIIDTATATAVVALGGADGVMRAEDAWRAGYRHGEELLARIDRLLGGAAASLEEVSGVVVGTGPGAFTGLRVGLATAKGIAHGLRIPLVGAPTGAALLAAAAAHATSDPTAHATSDPTAHATADPTAHATAGAATGGAGTSTGPRPLALLLPAGPSDRVLVHAGPSVLLPAGTEPDLPPGTLVVAVDLEGRADADASARGSRAVAGLGPALLRLGAARLAAGDVDDVALVVPEYVTLPRGVREQVGEVAWSRDRP